MLNLPDVQISAVRGGGAHNDLFLAAIKYSQREINFGKSLLISDQVPDPKVPGIESTTISPMDLNGYNDFMIRRLWYFQKLPFILIVQSDGFVVHPECWTDEFLEYDYIGAPWPAPEGQPCRQGNGGFSLRSKKLNLLLAEMINKYPQRENEDAYICDTYRKAIEDAGIKFAPPELAAKFSIEFRTWHHDGSPTFGFHGFYDGRNGTYFPLLQMTAAGMR